MAMYDDLSFIIPHIRNSFITNDDTGMCEMIIEGEDVGDRRGTDSASRMHSWHPNRYSRESSPADQTDSGMESSDGELSRSFDIIPDMEFGGHRRRSNTAQRLDKLRKERQQQIHVTTVKWKEDQDNYDSNEQGHLFQKRNVVRQDKMKRSSFTEQLESFDTAPTNPFSEYAKYDANANAGVPAKVIDIYLTMALPRDRPFPMRVSCITSGKVTVQDFLGLTLWLYHNQGREPWLMSTIESYALHIAEDDGEADLDFPALDIREPISKFGFAKLALVEKRVPVSKPKLSLVVTINLPQRGFSKLQIDDPNIPLREILAKVLKKRKLKSKGLEYMLELQTEPGRRVDLDVPLSSLGETEFCLVREHSVRGDGTEEEEVVDTSGMAASLSSHQYKSYRVAMSHKLGGLTEIQLGISGEKIELDPVSQKGTAKLFKQRAVTHECDDIASCDMVDQRKGIFRILYQAESGHDFKHHEFETNSEIAKEIVEKINNILEMRSSNLRKDYLALKEKKEKRMSRFHIHSH